MQVLVENNNTFGKAVCDSQLPETTAAGPSSSSPVSQIPSLPPPSWTFDSNIQEVEEAVKDEQLIPDSLPRHSGPGTSLRRDRIEYSTVHSAQQPELHPVAHPASYPAAQSSGQQQQHHRIRLVDNRPQQDLILEAQPIQRFASRLDCIKAGFSVPVAPPPQRKSNSPQPFNQESSTINSSEDIAESLATQTPDSLVSTTHRSRILSAGPFCASRTTTTRYGTDSPQERDIPATPRSLVLPQSTSYPTRSASSGRTVVASSTRVHCSPVPSSASSSPAVPTEAHSVHLIDEGRVLSALPVVGQSDLSAYLESGLHQNPEAKDLGEGRIITAHSDCGNPVS